MSLIKCKECGKEISDTAKKCPNCGFEIKRENMQLKKGSIIQIVANSLMIIIIATILIISNSGIEEESTSSNGGVTINVATTPDVINLSYVICFVLSIIISIIVLILNIVALNDKIKIKTYKIIIMWLSIAELICSIISLFGFMCCGVVYFIFPIINMIGAIIIATSRG